MDWLSITLREANIKAMIATKAFVLIVASLLIEQNRDAGGAGGAVLILAIEGACVILCETKPQRAAVAIGLINILVCGSIVAVWIWEGSRQPSGQMILWVAATFLVALICVFVARAPRETEIRSDRTGLKSD